EGGGWASRASWHPVSAIPVLSHDAVLAAVSPEEAIARTRDAFVRHHAREWSMPPKVYLDSPGHGDFRAMPARGNGLAMLKWISSFPGNPEHGLPTVMGVVVLSDAATSAPVALLDARSVTTMRRPPASWAAGCTARGPRAAWPPRGTGRACAAIRAPTWRGRWPTSSAGRSATGRPRWPATSS